MLGICIFSTDLAWLKTASWLSAIRGKDINLDKFFNAYETAIPLTMNLCEKVTANCFVNETYNPNKRNGTCPRSCWTVLYRIHGRMATIITNGGTILLFFHFHDILKQTNGEITHVYRKHRVELYNLMIQAGQNP